MEPQTKKAKTQHRCDQCDRMFQYRRGLLRHIKSQHGTASKFKCPTCHLEFNRKDNLDRHIKRHSQIGGAIQQPEGASIRKDEIEESRKKERQPGKHITDDTAGEEMDRNEQSNEENVQQQQDREEVIQNPEEDTADEEVCEEKALGGTIRKHVIPATGPEKFDPMTFLRVNYDRIKKVLKDVILRRGGLKWYVSLQIQMTRKQGDQVDKATPHFRNKCQMALKAEDLDEGLREAIMKIYNSFMEYQRRGSNWTVDKVIDIAIHMARYRPLRGSSYIPLPMKLCSKHAVINIQNKDNKCFMWSVLAALHPVKHHADKTARYRGYVDELNFNGITFPVTLADIPKFEKQNQITINVFGYEKGAVSSVHVTKQRYERHVDLLMISDGTKSHYCWVKSRSRLLGDQHTRHGAYHYCPYCLTGFTKARILQDHISYCQTHGAQKIELPKEEDKWLYYKDIRKELRAPYIIYADFESLQVPISGCDRDPEKSSTEKKTQHKPCGFAYKVVGLTPEHSKNLVVYRGNDAADKFVEYMVNEQEEIEKKFKEVKPLVMTGSNWQEFKNATRCHICQQELGNDRVRDHCHITGKFRGPAHNDCNINYKFTGRIPVILHNNRNYDSHIIMQAIGKVNKELKCIPNHMEKYISFSMGCMDFLDSYQFMLSSLEKLIENLAKDKEGNFVDDRKEKFKYMTEHFGEKQLDLLLRKQVYPYEYFDSDTRFEETELPPKESFYSSLSGEGIKDKDYIHAQNIWKEFGIKNLGQYHDLYVATDVVALADVFENFRDMCLEYYGLDAAHFYTSPGLAWQAALKMTGVQLELLTDVDMHLFIENGLRGGISMITHRYAKANNRYVPDYKPEVPSSHVMYLDANNLYGWAMSKPLPTHDFQWLDEGEFPNVMEVPEGADEGYIFEVDLYYPRELHDDHNDYPLAPEKFQMTEDMLSPYARELLEKLGMQGICTEKLIPNLHPKEKYAVHYSNLKLYLSLGMKLKKVHRVLRFKQSPWLKPYIDFNTNKRKKAKSEFEKDFFKLMNNSVFGKTMENLRKRVDVKLVNSQKKARKLTCKPSFHAFKIFTEDLVAIHMKKQKLYLNRPIYVGFSILDISKSLMYDFHYNYIKSKYGSRAQLLFTDTDSLCYCIQTKDIYEDMKPDLHLFDTSEYDQSHSLYSTENKKILGKMKDETKGLPVHEFIGLKSKMYSFVCEEVKKDGEKILSEKKRAKGIKKTVVKQQTRHQDYKDCLFNRETYISHMTQIRSYGHQLYNISMNKLGLSPFDDKRYLLDDGVSSLAYGHWRISEGI